MEVVLDTNVAVSAAINPKGPPAQIIRAWRAQSFTWVTSESLLAELERTLRSPRLKRYIAWSDKELNEFLAAVRQLTRVASPTRTIDIITSDPADNRVLEAAVAGGAEYIVSGDQALLDLGAFEGVQIVTPARFTAILAEGSSGRFEPSDAPERARAMKEFCAMVTRNCRVTVPAEVRRALGLEPGDRIAFVVDRGEVKLLRRGSVVERTARMLKGRRRVRTAEQLREAAEKAIGEEADERVR